MKIIVPVEIEVSGNDHTIEELMQAVEFCIHEEGYEDARRDVNVVGLMPELEILSMRVVFPENSK